MSVWKQKLIMEDMISRFPHIGEQIFRKLSNASLAKCRVVDRDWQNFIYYNKFYQIKIQKLMLRYKKWYCSEKKITPLHLAAATGQTQIVMDTIKEEGTIDHYFKPDEEEQLSSPLHYAVGWMGYRERKGGYLSVCRELINKIRKITIIVLHFNWLLYMVVLRFVNFYLNKCPTKILTKNGD